MENTQVKKIYAAGTHCVMIHSVTYSETLDNMAQIIAPEGYEVVSVNYNPSQISCNLTIYRNIEDVLVDTYRQEDGKEVSPKFGVPLRKLQENQSEQNLHVEDIKLR